MLSASRVPVHSRLAIRGDRLQRPGVVDFPVGHQRYAAILERAARRIGAAIAEFAQCLRVVAAARIRQRADQQRRRERVEDVRAAGGDAGRADEGGRFVHRAEHERRSVLVFLGVVAAQRETERVGRFPAQRDLSGAHVLVAEVLAIELASDVTVALAHAQREARGPVATERQVEGAERFTKVVFAQTDAHGVAGVGSGFVGGQQHRAADGVAAEQGSLRAAQDLHVGDVAKFHGRAHRAAHVDIVDVHADARVDGGRGIALADAANEHLRGGVVAGQRSVGMELDVRRHLVEIGGADDLLPLERVGAQRSHRHGRVLQAFGAAPRGDDDGLEGLGFRLTAGRRLVAPARPRCRQ